MLSPSTRVTKTYSRRRLNRTPAQRIKPNPPQHEGPPSSPLNALPAEKQDVSVDEMSHRMKKRSRQVSASGQDASVNDTREHGERLSKKMKSKLQSDSCSIFNSTYNKSSPLDAYSPMATPSRSTNKPLLPLATHQINDSLFETPFPSDETIIKSYIVPLADEPLSPVPIGRRMLSRTSSRNFKENRTHSGRPLASPFHSRPVSRSPSPVKASHSATKRPAFHNKSRTLSTSSLRNEYKQTTGDNLDSVPLAEDSLFDTTRSNSKTLTHAQTMKSVLHNRTASIPNISSTCLGDIPPEEWLVPPKALQRSPPKDMHLDVFQADFPSFYFDMPNQASTPARKRQTTVTLKSFHEDNPTSSTAAWSDDSDVEMATVNPEESPRQPRRRRRTVVHISSDSIFSSALDFSAYLSDPASPTQILKRSRGSSSTSMLPSFDNDLVLPKVPTLDSAFSPAPVPPAPTDLENTGTPPSSASQNTVRRAAGYKDAIGNSISHSVHGDPLSDDELYGMFSKLGIRENAESASQVLDAGTGKTLPRIQSQPSMNGRPHGMTHQRKRGDTIRARDFTRPAEPNETVSPMRFSSRSAHVDLLPPNTRRTRSGTVTLAKPAAQVATRPKHTRRRQALPTIKMRVEDPLPQQASDEEDDELLIKHDTVWQDDD